jgi:hypothetical protein
MNSVKNDSLINTFGEMFFGGNVREPFKTEAKFWYFLVIFHIVFVIKSLVRIPNIGFTLVIEDIPASFKLSNIHFSRNRPNRYFYCKIPLICTLSYRILASTIPTKPTQPNHNDGQNQQIICNVLFILVSLYRIKKGLPIYVSPFFFGNETINCAQ